MWEKWIPIFSLIIFFLSPSTLQLKLSNRFGIAQMRKGRNINENGGKYKYEIKTFEVPVSDDQSIDYISRMQINYWRCIFNEKKEKSIYTYIFIRFFFFSYVSQVDHFSFAVKDKFNIRYLVNDTWRQENNAPIFFYTGNEGDIEVFAENTVIISYISYLSLCLDFYFLFLPSLFFFFFFFEKIDQKMFLLLLFF